MTPRAAEVLRRGLETARLDPDSIAVRVWVAGGAARTAFADEPEDDDVVVEAGGVRVFVAASATAGGPIAIDVSAEHEQIVVLPLD